jgi:hypothetical protein
MAHFAQLDENNIVLQIIVVNNKDIYDEYGIENESIGIEFCKSLFGKTTNWKQTSYNKTIRKKYAGIGYSYNEIYNAFIPPKLYNSWIFNENNCNWEAPIPYPIDGNNYIWNEETMTWQIAGNKNA